MRPSRTGFPRAVVALIAASLCWFLTTPSLATDEYDDFAELDLESLLDQTIVTAGKHEQKISDTPVAATVITAEEIAASGARSRPELLDRVAGLDVLQTSSSSFEVAARGLVEPGCNTMLVLVDGRSVYEEFYGQTVWGVLTVSIEDVKAIEVIKGPGSAMYGANAFAGVINILTFAPEEKTGTVVRTFVSALGESQGTLRTAGRQDALGWDVSTTWDRSLDWEVDQPQSESVTVNGRLEYDLGERSRVGLEAGAFNGELALLPGAAEVGVDGQNSFVRADLTWGDLDLRWYVNDWDFDIVAASVDLIGQTATLANQVHDLEFQHSFRPGADTFVLWGGRYLHKRYSYSLQPDDVRQNVYAGFALAEWEPRPSWLLSLGVRYEHHPLVGGHAAPRGGLVYKPHPDHALRASYSEAYRDPSYLETYWRTEIEVLPGFGQLVHGDLDVDSEKIQSVEVGYQGLVTSNVLVNLAVFHNEMTDLIQMVPVATYPSPPAPFPGIPAEWAFRNTDAWDSTGGEVACDADLASWLRLSGFYAYDWLQDSATGARITKAPRHSAQVRATLRLGRQHELRAAARYRAATDWAVDVTGTAHTAAAAERLVYDALWYVRLDPGDRRVSLGIQNLLDERYRDHPLAIEQRRRLFAALAIAF